jgi:adenylate cyclase
MGVTDAIYRFGGFELDVGRGLLHSDAGDLYLRPKSYELLRHLVENPQRLMPKDELVDLLWPDVAVCDDSLAQCIRDVRRTLGDDGTRFIKTLPRRGYMFVADVERLTSCGKSRESAPAPLPPRQSAAIAILGLAMVLGIALLWTTSRETTTAPHSGRLAVAVLPFASVGPEQAHLGEGLAEDVVAAVARFRDLAVIARSSSFRYDPHDEDLRKIARELGVDYVLRGSVRRTADHLRVTAQLLDLHTFATVWMEQYDRPFAELLSIPDEVASGVAARLVGHAREAAAVRLGGRDAATLLAYELVLRGRRAYRTFSQEGAIEARELARRAIELDPEFPPGWELLAVAMLQFYLQPYDESQGSRPVLEEAHAAALRAVALDPAYSTARAVVGYTLLWLRQHEESIKALHEAVALNANDANAFTALAEVLAFNGDHAAALEAWDRAQELDPLSPPLRLALKARSHTFLGQPEAAFELANACALAAPRLSPCFVQLAIAAQEAGREREAEEAVARLLEINPRFTITRQLQLVPIRHADEATRFAHLLRSAGLPD